jgi:DNA replication protein DnaC
MSSLASKDQVVVRSFAFTKVFGQEDTQEDVYEEAAFSLVENVIAGYNGTIFAYGQTASGKTYTIMGAK